jgi:hypothetical protein
VHKNKTNQKYSTANFEFPLGKEQEKKVGLRGSEFVHLCKPGVLSSQNKTVGSFPGAVLRPRA